MVDADVDRGDRLRVAFTVTLPELLGAEVNYPHDAEE
jgi:hypothetical protein